MEAPTADLARDTSAWLPDRSRSGLFMLPVSRLTSIDGGRSCCRNQTTPASTF